MWFASGTLSCFLFQTEVLQRWPWPRAAGRAPGGAATASEAKVTPTSLVGDPGLPSCGTHGGTAAAMAQQQWSGTGGGSRERRDEEERAEGVRASE